MFLKYISIFFITLLSPINTCKVLTLSGGGSFGAFEMGIVSTLIDKNKGGWDVITGVSAGSINAAYLSTVSKTDEKISVPEFKKLWLSTTNDKVYSKMYFLNGISMYDTLPLKNTLNDIFINKTSIRPVIISATSLVNGNSEKFNQTDINNYGFIDIILSSTAIPIYFPPHQFKNDSYVDGGLTSNILLYEGINYCLQNKPNEEINVDVIVCGKKLGKDLNMNKSIKFKDYINRLIGIISQQVEYYQLLDNILVNKPKVNITIYEENNNINIDLIDFEQSEYLWNQGYNFTNVNIYNNVYFNTNYLTKYI